MTKSCRRLLGCRPFTNRGSAGNVIADNLSSPLHLGKRLPPPVVIHRDAYNDRDLGPELDAYDHRRHAARPLGNQINVEKFGTAEFYGWSENTARRLAETHARIVAIKDSSGDVPFMMALIDAIAPSRPDFSFMTGWDACLLPMLQLGCHGGTNATSGVAPELTRKLFDLASNGRHEEARKVQRRVTQIFDKLFAAADFPEGFRVGLAARGIAVGPGRTPRSSAQRAGDDATQKELREILAAEGLD